MRMNTERWSRLMRAWGFGPNGKTYRELVAAYSQKHRHYHTGAHIDDCLGHLPSVAKIADNEHEIELALWFHDAIYKPLSANNERHSADWACNFLRTNGAVRDARDRVQRLIMVTEHDAPTETRDESILVDIDLSILGAEPAVYDRFEAAVRKEYKVVPEFLYRGKRAEILQGFVARERIYANEPFAGQRENQARENLARAITALAG